MKRGTTTLLKLIVILIAIFILISCIFWLPWIANKAATMNPSYAYLRLPVLLGLYITAIPLFLALYHSFKLLGYINSKNAFSELAVISLKRVKYSAISIIILYGIGMLFLESQDVLLPLIALIGIIIIFAAFVISLFAAILQELFKNALEIKSENELTV
ncbi:DUF2975 domain-containing protein [Psychrobacillus sp. FSL H8-0484]|uniref:DUF2975 domain-containing protein n=1 Tax=Psychrobacillus sp. FSL H8-0484 TaxID=2921390 RepID=UPI0030F7A25A